LGTTEQRLAGFAVGTPAEDIPSASVVTARTAIIDTVGCALAAVREPLGVRLLALLDQDNGYGDAAVLGSGRRAGVADAAMVNSALAHGLDLDDFDKIGHVSSMVVPAVLASAEKRGASGREVLDAYIIGMEVLSHLAAGVTKVKRVGGIHATAAFGVLAATAAVARLERLTVEQTVTAFGIAASTPSGIPENFGTFTASLHAGFAARSAVQAARLAAGGWTATPDAIEGPTGWGVTFFGPGLFDTAKMTADLGSVWYTTTPRGVRRYPCCLSNTSAVDSLLALRAEHGFTAEDVQSVIVRNIPPASNIMRYGVPDDAYAGKFSIVHTLAAALIDGAVTLDSFKPPMLERADYRAAVGLISPRVLAEWETRSAGPGMPVTVVLKDGREFSRTSPGPLSPSYAHLTGEEIKAKFLAGAARSLGPEQAELCLDAWSGLAEADDVTGLVKAATSPGEAR
jgi:2-methylcitrate dehydratase PrpD